MAAFGEKTEGCESTNLVHACMILIVDVEVFGHHSSGARGSVYGSINTCRREEKEEEEEKDEAFRGHDRMGW